MTTELWYLFLTSVLLTVLWIPYIIGSVQTAGPLQPEEYRVGRKVEFPHWVRRADRAHINRPTTEFCLFPNPGHSSFTIRFNRRHSAGQLSYTTSAGQTVFRKTIESNLEMFIVSTSNWAAGNYFICWQPAGCTRQCATITIR